MKVVINVCYGGFSLSEEAIIALQQAGIEDADWFFRDSQIGLRSNAQLVQVVESLGQKAWGNCSALKVIELPDNVDVYIDDYDGSEIIREQHKTWG